MTVDKDLHSLKTFAKRLARSRRIAHHESLDLVAARLQQPHWNALISAWESGWRPELHSVDALAHLLKTADADVMDIPVLGIGLGVKEEDVIDGHSYSLEIDFEVLMGGYGWCILVDQAPSKKPVIEIYDQSEDNPILDAGFRTKALAISNEAAERLRARIARDWPRRSTKPDADGQAQHPLSKGVAATWYCLHCDGEFTGAQMAENMWHCPACSATPLDIFVERFWKAA